MAESIETKYLCKYRIGMLVMAVGEERLILDHSNVLSIEVLEDFDFNIRAMLKLTLRVDARKKIWLIQNKSNILCHFELDKFGQDIDTNEDIIGDSICFDEDFRIFFNDDVESSDIAIMEERIKLNDPTASMNDLVDENYFESQNVLDVYLFKKNFIAASMQTINKVFTKDVLQNMVGRILTLCKQKDVLMSRCENSTVYDELLIPAMPAYESLIYLDERKGLYKMGAIIFYGIQWFYILNSNGKMTARYEDEWTDVNIIITGLDNSIPGNGMIRKEGEKVYYMSIPDMNITPQKTTNANNLGKGSDIRFTITDDIEIETASANQSFTNNRNTKIVFRRKSDNKYLSDIMKARMEENEVIMYISGDNFDINAFAPNHQFILTFEDPGKQEKFGKFKYRIAYHYTMLKMDGTELFSPSHHIVLKKCGS